MSGDLGTLELSRDGRVVVRLYLREYQIAELGLLARAAAAAEAALQPDSEPAATNHAEVAQEAEPAVKGLAEARASGDQPEDGGSSPPLRSIFDPPSGGGGQAPEPAAEASVIPPAPANSPLSQVSITCDRCERTFGSQHALNVHRGRVHHDLKPLTEPAITVDEVAAAGPYHCFLHGLDFADGKALADHRRTHR